ncbi:type II toxin-antitoxin system Phd/YefM family antitoxin [Nocardia macrotermitis]|uniref:Antitoxin n=1 Tax=Nocardia macrotermitis TaxID=2585198 RepID=A0A7K0DEY4_9NOCA|nr:type II toxin-antitoxin system prevent-host-death family antitoxin [Nocardia macrotermitis]MQY24277.1 hypothetical protein [Nocardia macrotermitis]
MAIVIVSEARATLPDLLDRVERGEEITITRHGQAVATLVRPDVLVTRRADTAFAQADHLRDVLEQGRKAALTDLPGMDPARAEALVEDVRSSRDAR